MANFLQQVQTYQLSSLAILQNMFAFVSTSNTQFNDFQNFSGNLGSTVTFDLPPRITSVNDLVITTQGVEQRVKTLTVDQQASSSYTFSAQEFIFNVEDYIRKFGRSAMADLGTKIEKNVARNAITNTYRFFGNGIDPIDSVGQIAQMLAFFRNYGSATTDYRAYLSDMMIPQIINTMLNQFVIDRNQDGAQSWMLGMYDNCDFYRSNLLPIHNAGNVGENATTLTVVSINPAGTQITFSGAAISDADAVKQYDKFQFQDGVSGQPNLRFLTFTGYSVSDCPVQFRATADAASDGSGNVVVNIFPALISTAGNNNQNIDAATPVASGMQVKALPSHRAGLLTSGNALYLAMPRLPEMVPYPTANAVDPDSGIAIRNYYGSVFGQNQYPYVNDCIWGSTLADDYAMEIVVPLTIAPIS